MSKTTKQVLVAIPVILLLIALAIPNFVKPRNTYSKNACANNLNQIERAKKEWARAKQKTVNDIPTWDDLRPYIIQILPMDALPTCPSGGGYTVGRVGEPVKCS